ncbi:MULTISPECIES: triose-phosphate isomerase [Desulfotignum]|jgi:triosephosphate isomerase|uniref:Triosephosphate isomerase n=1 Tax=Desulfotignum phosphitoxidans DSM 13687 TaxID=1286635 RepID=S0G6K0_9BACT|nr:MULTISPECIES: triose-phosphate isomerase [Desulfotignum]EMS80111.1 triosephosphate isomerase TpiA [Desulfotignum phosphitoxidans DSM 13687]
MTRIPLIAGNWKMFKTGPEAVDTATHLAQACADVQNKDIMIAPTYVCLPLVATAIADTSLHLGAQNLHFEKQGAFTGEISADMLAAAGVEYVIIGHSERRQYFFETDETVNKKILAAVSNRLKPILCIGETLAQREAGNTFLTLDKQVADGLKSVDPERLQDLVIAYEPVWAIGTGETAGPEQVETVHRFLRTLVDTKISSDLARTVRIIYGGSVKPDNIATLMCIEDVDGVLVGGASLDARIFTQIVKYD